MPPSTRTFLVHSQKSNRRTRTTTARTASSKWVGRRRQKVSKAHQSARFRREIRRRWKETTFQNPAKKQTNEEKGGKALNTNDSNSLLFNPLHHFPLSGASGVCIDAQNRTDPRLVLPAIGVIIRTSARGDWRHLRSWVTHGGRIARASAPSLLQHHGVRVVTVLGCDGNPESNSVGDINRC